MAKKVKETPVLTGKSAERFENIIRENSAKTKKVSQEEYRRAMDTFSRFVINA